MEPYLNSPHTSIQRDASLSAGSSQTMHREPVSKSVRDSDCGNLQTRGPLLLP
jgi:hypothetical protein